VSEISILGLAKLLQKFYIVFKLYDFQYEALAETKNF